MGQPAKQYFAKNDNVIDIPDDQLFIKVSDGLIYNVDDTNLFSHLKRSPHIDQITDLESQGLKLDLPDMDGELITYTIAKYDMVEAGMYTQFPEIMTFIGKGTDGSSIRADYTYLGFRAWIINGNKSYMIEPYSKFNKNLRLVYSGERELTQDEYSSMSYKTDYHHNEKATAQNPVVSNASSRISGIATVSQLKTYRLAISANSYYLNYFGNFNLAISGIITTVNRVNQVFEVDLSTRLILISNNSQIIYFSAFPYQVPPSDLINTVQTTINNVIGANNYDIGHLFTSFPHYGASSDLGVACNSSSKA